jgi:hypothetical protein
MFRGERSAAPIESVRTGQAKIREMVGASVDETNPKVMASLGACGWNLARWSVMSCLELAQC